MSALDFVLWQRLKLLIVSGMGGCASAFFSVAVNLLNTRLFEESDIKAMNLLGLISLLVASHFLIKRHFNKKDIYVNAEQIFDEISGVSYVYAFLFSIVYAICGGGVLILFETLKLTVLSNQTNISFMLTYIFVVAETAVFYSKSHD